MVFSSDDDTPLSEEEFRLLRDFIHEKFGIYFDTGDRALLRSRLLGRLNNLDLVSFEDYYHYLKFGPQRNEELWRMITHLTNNETEFFRNWQVEIVGVDVDQVALEKAKKGIYHHNSFRSVSPEIVERHFLSHGNGAHQVKESLRRQVRFVHGNIIEPATYEPLQPVDVIICRNVLIYFS